MTTAKGVVSKMFDGAAKQARPSLDDVMIKVSIGIGRNITEAEHSLAQAKQRKGDGNYYNIRVYGCKPLPAPEPEHNPVVDSFLRLEQRLLSEGFEDEISDLDSLKYDAKTGLLNRMGYEVEVRKLHHREAYADRVIILIDGDNMKHTNTLLGYEETDRYLEAIGRALKSQIRQAQSSKKGSSETDRETDVLVNRKNDSGGDEFIIDLGCDYCHAGNIAKRYVDAMYQAQAALERKGERKGEEKG
jgi:GGDEF domain-containing protein